MSYAAICVDHADEAIVEELAQFRGESESGATAVGRNRKTVGSECSETSEPR